MVSVELSYTLPVEGAKPSKISSATLDKYGMSNINYSGIYGASLASCLFMMFSLLVVVRKKKTIFFILNQCTLLAMAIKSALYLAYLHGPLGSIAYLLFGLVDDTVRRAYKVSVAGSVFQLVVVCLIEVSMTTQIFVIFRSPEVRVLRYMLTGFSVALGLTILGLYVNDIVVNWRYFYDEAASTTQVGSWRTDLPTIMFTVSVNLMSVVLVTKLALAIKTRRYLGLRQFDGFHILFITTTQTMIVPSIFALINFSHTKNKFTELMSVAMVLVVLSLPLSSMWAAAANNSSVPKSSHFTLTDHSDSGESTESTVYSLFPRTKERQQSYKQESCARITTQSTQSTQLSTPLSASIRVLPRYGPGGYE